MDKEQKIIELENRIKELENKFRSLESAGTIPKNIKDALNNLGFILIQTGLNDPSDMTGEFTVTISSPAVFTTTKPHNLFVGQRVYFSTTGALPTGITPVTQDYYIISDGLSSNTFKVSETDGGSPINTSGTQSGTHTFQNSYGTFELLPTKYGRVLERDSNRFYIPLYSIGQF